MRLGLLIPPDIGFPHRIQAARGRRATPARARFRLGHAEPGSVESRIPHSMMSLARHETDD